MAGLDFDTAAQLVADLSHQMASLWARLEVLETTMPPVLPCSAPAITTTPHVFTCGVREHAPVDTTAASPTPSKSKIKESSCRRLMQP
jgi:hypothetical protein